MFFEIFLKILGIFGEKQAKNQQKPHQIFQYK